MSDELNRSIEALWRDYEYLTQEISKFVNQRDNNMINNLLSQRNKLEKIIAQKNDQTYNKTPEGRALISSILALNNDAASRMQRHYNGLKQQHRVFLAYEGESASTTMYTRRRLDTDL